MFPTPKLATDGTGMITIIMFRTTLMLIILIKALSIALSSQKLLTLLCSKMSKIKLLLSCKCVSVVLFSLKKLEFCVLFLDHHQAVAELTSKKGGYPEVY